MGLQWLDADEDDELTMVHTEKVYHYTKGQNKGYGIIGTCEGFDKSFDVDDNYGETFDVFAWSTAIYTSIVKYYKENNDPDIVLYEFHEDAGAA